jgi:hypothetical protein
MLLVPRLTATDNTCNVAPSGLNEPAQEHCVHLHRPQHDVDKSQIINDHYQCFIKSVNTLSFDEINNYSDEPKPN